MEEDKTSQKEDTTETNFAKFRAKLEHLEADRKAALEKISELEKRLEAQSSSEKEEEEYDDYDYVDAKAHKAAIEKTKLEVQQEMERRLEEYQRAQKRQEYSQRYADYEKVVTEENVAKLKQRDPYFCSLLPLVSDELERSAQTYEKIKSMLKEEEVPKKTMDHTRAHLHSTPFTSFGSTPLDGVDGMRDPTARKAAYKRMMELRGSLTRG